MLPNSDYVQVITNVSPDGRYVDLNLERMNLPRFCVLSDPGRGVGELPGNVPERWNRIPEAIVIPLYSGIVLYIAVHHARSIRMRIVAKPLKEWVHLRGKRGAPNGTVSVNLVRHAAAPRMPRRCTS